MNTETGQIYEGLSQIKAAVDRGEPLVPVSKSLVREVREVAHSKAFALKVAHALVEVKERWPKMSEKQQEQRALEIARAR